ncbi:hypothetical protein [Micromonospora chersina]
MHELFLPLALYVRPSGTPDQPDDSNKILHFRSVSDSAPQLIALLIYQLARSAV